MQGIAYIPAFFCFLFVHVAGVQRVQCLADLNEALSSMRVGRRQRTPCHGLACDVNELTPEDSLHGDYFLSAA